MPESLAVQRYLWDGNTLESLASELGISVYHHPSLPLAGFKYSQVDSPKTHPVVRSCRGTVLEKGSWDAVAVGFRRFFNAGEDPSFAGFDWGDFGCTTKEDGSLILLYWYAGDWHANTSGSFGLGECNFSGRTWRELFWATSGIDRSRLDRDYTYVWELWTPYNKVVRTYARSQTFLLSMFHVPTLSEVPAADADGAAARLGVPRPEHHRFSSMDEVSAFLRRKEREDRTFEGVVLRGRDGERYKLKSATYLALHHLVDNGNLFNPKRLVPLVLAGDTDEVVAYLPEVGPHLESVRGVLEGEFRELAALWRATWQIESQGDFARAILGKSRFTHLLFALRKSLGPRQDEPALLESWRRSADAIVKALY